MAASLFVNNRVNEDQVIGELNLFAINRFPNSLTSDS